MNLFSLDACTGRAARPGLRAAAAVIAGVRGLLGCFALGLLASPAQARTVELPPALKAGEGVEIRRTTDGIPHLRASSWKELGAGVGYVQAQDALCTLAEAFVTYEGRRSWFFGAEQMPARDSTLGRPSNLDLDFFFRAFANQAMLAQYRAQQPGELNELIEGYAAGYNRQLAELRGAPALAAQPACAKAAWLRPITADDIYRRFYAAQVAAGYGHLIPQIVNAQPPAATARADAGPPADADSHAGSKALQALLSKRVGEQAGLGSNAFAFGREATGENGSVLFGNPHWYWGGPDRFYQMHLTLPGKLDVAGVSFLGIPLVMIGFNADVAWSHTVSQARRFGLFDLSLDAADPTRVVIDGESEAMQSRQVSVALQPAPARHGKAIAGAGQARSRTVTRQFYSTRFGPVIDLGSHNAAFAWGREHALAMRDVNAPNFRVFRNYFDWNQSHSLDEFIAIQRREAAVPWVNTVAIARGDGRVWYGDVGAVPNVPDALRAECATELSKGFAQFDPLTPLLDGSRSACDWRIDARAAQPGTLPAAEMPSLLREDYVANMNDSYWLTNAHRPLEGFASVLGGERQPLSLRGRLGHQMALSLSAVGAASAEALSQLVMADTLTPRAFSAELFKAELLDQACAVSPVVWQAPGPDGATEQVQQQAKQHAGKAGPAAKPRPARKVDIGRACEVLRQWSGRADADARGALLWDAFWAQLEALPSEAPYKAAFSADVPLDTPRGAPADGRAAQALAAAVVAMKSRHIALDAPLGSQRFVRSGGEQVPLYGGCHSAGYFTVACNPQSGGEVLGVDSHANSYLQVVRFGSQGVVARTLLAHGLKETAVDNGDGDAPVERYARKAWLEFPFTEAEIAQDPGYQRSVIRLDSQ